MLYRTLGGSSLRISAIGLGCMPFNHGYGTPDETSSIATMEKAIELGINFWDTADFYANTKNEELISKVLRSNRDKIIIATKFGFIPNERNVIADLDGSPKYMRQAIEGSLKRLGTDVVDLYYLHRVDPKVPIEESVGAMSDLVKEGKVRYLGLSEVSTITLRKANAVHPISALQSEYSLLSRDVEQDILGTCRELKITFVPFSPLARGLMANRVDPTTLLATDFRKNLPRYSEKYRDNNTQLASAFEELADGLGLTPARLALAWLLAQGDHIVPIPGTKHVAYLEDNARAAEIKLKPEEIELIEELIKKFPDTGPRYNEAYQKFVEKD
jgi:aryl-alcohol dehydrogenase-like predicted oxidoreductase